MSKLIKGLSVGTLILPIILCIIAMCHKFDYGRIVIDTVLLLTAIVGLRVVFHQLKIKENDLVLTIGFDSGGLYDIGQEKGYGTTQDMWIKGISQSMFEAKV